MDELTPFVGMRFKLHDIEFEVVFIGQGVVRYSSHIGGRQYTLPISKFAKILDSDSTRVNPEENTITLTQENSPIVLRKHQYIKAALLELDHPTSGKKLPKIISSVAGRINDPSPPCVSTVAKWVEKYRRHGNKSLPHKTNRCGNRSKRFSPEIDYLITEAIEKEYLSNELRSAFDVLAYVVAKFHEREDIITAQNTNIPSIRTIQRRIKNIDPYLVLKSKKGSRLAEKMSRSAGCSTPTWTALSDVQIDTHKLDLILIDPDTKDIIGRPYLSLIIDKKTRAIVGRYICMYPPSAATSLAALVDMITRPNNGLPGGIPSKITPDNGVEFKNTSFMHVCEQLCITITPAPIEDPDAKPHVERFFGTLTHGAIQKIPGTTFSNPVEKGKYQSHKKAFLKLERLLELVDEWINEIYHTKIHSITGRAPILAWEDEVNSAHPLFLSETEAQAIARRPVTRTIQHGQVQIDYLHYYSHALAALHAQGITQVTVLVDDLNLHDVFIKNPLDENHLIKATSTDPEYTLGLTCYMHQESQKMKQELTQKDIKRLGPLANLFARWKLLEKIQKENTAAKRWIKKLTNGKGRKNACKDIEQDIMTPDLSALLAEEHPFNTPPDHENSVDKEPLQKQTTQQYKSIYIE